MIQGVLHLAYYLRLQRTRALWSTYPAHMLHLTCILHSCLLECATIFTDIVLWTYAHEQIAHGLQSTGVANKNTVFVTLVGLANRFEA